MENITVSKILDVLYPPQALGEVCLAIKTEYFSHYRVVDGVDDFCKNKQSYVCVSTVANTTKRLLRRRKKDCIYACVVMLDDVGTKVSVPEVEPTAILETSKGNFQYVYRIEPFNVQENLDYYEACLKRLADAGWTDGGALGANRVFRLPGSVNIKEGKRWECRVTEWSPEKVWVLKDLMTEFGIKNIVTKSELKEAGQAVFKSPHGEDGVLTWLHEHDFITGQREDWYLIDCPWKASHSNGDPEAAYNALGEGDQPMLRGFQCFHEHCATKKIPQFLAWVAENGGPQVTPTAGTDDITALLSELKNVSTEEKYQVIESAIPKLNAFNLPDLKTDVNGKKPLATQLHTSVNIAWVLEQCGIRLQFNMMLREPEVAFKDSRLQEMVPNKFAILRCINDECLRLGIKNQKAVEDIIVERATNYGYHPMALWVLSKPWDGQERIVDLARSVEVVSSDKTLWPKFLRKWLIQGIQAVCGWKTPSQVGSVLVFQGEQGVGKGKWFASIVPPEFYTSGQRLQFGHDYKDSILRVTQTPITELGELDSTFSKTDIGALKAFLTSEIDVIRPPYGKDTLRIPRATIFCGTVNKVDFLVDETGARRYWPVSVAFTNPEHGIDLQQLWAEAHHYWARGDIWWLEKDETKRHERLTQFHKITSPLEDAFNDYVHMTRNQDKKYWLPMNLSTFVKQLGMTTHPANMSFVRGLLDRKFGQRRARLQGVQNCWLVPDPQINPTLKEAFNK